MGQFARHQTGLGIELEAFATFEQHVASHFEVVAFLAALEFHAHFAGLVVVDFQRAEKVQVVDGKRSGLAIAAQRFRCEFQVSGAGQQRLARGGTVAIQNPAIRGSPVGREQPVTGGIEGGFVQQRTAGRVARRRSAFTQAAGHGLGRHAHLVPDAPVNRQHLGATPCAAASVGVEVFVGRHVVHLARGRGDGAGG